MRLRGYDYSQSGAYFVTICARHRKCLFGSITDGKMRLSEIGQIVLEYWKRIPQHFPSVKLGEFVIMPNHMHGIITFGIPEISATHLPENTRDRRGEVSSPLRDIITCGISEVNATHLPENTRDRRGEVSSPSLGRIVAYFKYQSTKRINQHRNMPETRIWQRNYYDHIIRDAPDLQRLCQYIQNNPMKWELDQLHPDNPSRW